LLVQHAIARDDGRIAVPGMRARPQDRGVFGPSIPVTVERELLSRLSIQDEIRAAPRHILVVLRDTLRIEGHCSVDPVPRLVALGPDGHRARRDPVDRVPVQLVVQGSYGQARGKPVGCTAREYDVVFVDHWPVGVKACTGKAIGFPEELTGGSQSMGAPISGSEKDDTVRVSGGIGDRAPGHVLPDPGTRGGVQRIQASASAPGVYAPTYDQWVRLEPGVSSIRP